MAFDGNGNWISNFSAVADRNADIKILASRFDNIFIADLADSFENCLTKDAQVKPTQNFDANNFRIIDVANPVADNDAVNLATLNDRIAKVEQDPILAYKWSDYEIADQSWLRADTFSWNDGTVYTNAYTHLYNDIQDISSSTETVGSYTITYYQADDGHKIVMPNQETTVQNIYNESGVAWYYILDTTNQRFKLPRGSHGGIVEKYQNGKDWYRVYSDGWCEQGGNSQTDRTIYLLKPFANTNYNVHITTTWTTQAGAVAYAPVVSVKQTGSFYCGNYNAQQSDWIACGYISSVHSNPQYNYLYFYVGQFSQSATEQTAGLNSELFNNKVDLDAANLSDAGKSLIAGLGMPSDTYDDLTLGASGTEYTAPADGYVMLQKLISSVGQYAGIFAKINNNDYYCVSEFPASVNRARSFLPVKKGQKYTVGYTAGGTTEIFRFIYAVGSESEAS